MQRSATISDCGRYRYELTRCWDETKGKALFLGLNPSDADGEKDDPTSLRCLGVTQDGSPKHPLARGFHRIPEQTYPTIWKPNF